jgi:hypothetical protein
MRSQKTSAQPVSRSAAEGCSRGKTAAPRTAFENRRPAAQQIAQLVSLANGPAAAAPNRTGLPGALKAGIEGLSGHSLNHVRVHRNSSKPGQLNAHAYAQGSDIHLAAGQEKHLPHEAWHVVQQAQGRVKPTLQAKGVAINDDAGLEKEADVMGAKAQLSAQSPSGNAFVPSAVQRVVRQNVLQRVLTGDAKTEAETLEAATAGPNEGLRARASALLKGLTKPVDVEDRTRVLALVEKFSRPKAAAAVSASAEPKAKRWGWSPEQEGVARMLFLAQGKVFEAAERVGQLQTRERSTQIAQESADASAPPVTIPMVEYTPDQRAAGLGIWAQLLTELRGVEAQKDRLHVIHFRTIEGKVITVALSEHKSSHNGKPDYFVHDSRATLVKTPASGIQQGRQPDLQAHLEARGDTLNVSYEAFVTKIALIKHQLEVADATVAEWLLLIIMSPSIAPAAIRRQAPKLTDGQLHVMYELVATWMLAEPARHASSMLSGVMELELIEAGAKTFAQSLSKTAGDAHPMSHIGSEAQGRDAEAAEISVGIGVGVPKGMNVSKVLHKQSGQLATSFSPQLAAAEAGLEELVRFYTTELEETIGRL